VPNAKLLAISILSLSLVCCSTQRPAQTSSTDKTAPSCEIDAVKICQDIRKKPVLDSDGLTRDPRNRELSGPPTTSETWHYPIPNGATVEIECEINVQHSTVVYAHVLKGPRLTEHDTAQLRE
jgi:hypothetical protein